MKPIPITAGKRIAETFGYDQVVIVARKTGRGEGTGEHVTTYGDGPGHRETAEMIGHFFKHRLMGWPEPTEDGNQEAPCEHFGAAAYRANVGLDPKWCPECGCPVLDPPSEGLLPPAMAVTLARSALGNLLTAVLQEDALQAMNADLRLAVKEARRVMGFPFESTEGS